ncbi:hypothetical protein DFH06DRAFT_675535 [Mycena polygramma]|nr:hypothetical protein DFH06DRAFT_675535 [Mycena polygramma]
MARAFYLSGMAFLFCALVLSFLSSISLPYLPALDFTRVKFAKGFFSGSDTLQEVRWGIWGPCVYDGNDHRTCVHTGHGYTIPIRTLDGQEVDIGASWTRGLAIHPVATAVVAIAFGLGIPTVSVITVYGYEFTTTVTVPKSTKGGVEGSRRCRISRTLELYTDLRYGLRPTVTVP